MAFFEFGLQHALNGFAAACDTAAMKINIFKTVILRFSRNHIQYSLQVGGVSLKKLEKFKYLGVAFTSGRRQDEELNARSDKALLSRCTIQLF